MRYKFTIEYNGTFFNGYAKQENKKTIQGVIEKNLSELLNEKITIHASGRTDKYVHAVKQVIHFDTNKILNKFMIKHLNKCFKNEIKIKRVEIVDNSFHSRYSVKEKIYMYKINVGKVNIFESNICYQYNKKINVNKLNKIKCLFIGKHNFLSFSTSDKKDTIRTIYNISFIELNNYLYIFISGNGFLRNMVRMIIACFIKFNENRISEDKIKQLLLNPKKGSSIDKIAGCGLYLYDIKY